MCYLRQNCGIDERENTPQQILLEAKIIYSVLHVPKRMVKLMSEIDFKCCDMISLNSTAFVSNTFYLY